MYTVEYIFDTSKLPETDEDYTKTGDSWSNILIIKNDETEIARYYDNGEPEDNSFIRDWGWVKGELSRAYGLGLAKGKLMEAKGE